MTRDIILLFTVLIFTSVTIPFIGLSILKINSNYNTNKLNLFFKSICIGLVFIVTLFSIIITKGKTINILFIPLFFFYYFWDRSRANIIKESFLSFHKKHLHQYLIFILFTTLFFCISYLLYALNQHHFIKLPHPDIVFYSKLSNYLLSYKIETKSLVYYSLNQNIMPYHYFEIWLNSIYTFFTNKPSLNNFVFITYPIGIATVCFGFYAILKQKFNYKKILIPASTILVFWTGLSNTNYPINSFFDASSLICRNLFIYPKLFIVYIFVIGTIISVINKEHKNIFYYTIFASISSITLMVPIAITVGFLFVYFFAFKKQALIHNSLYKYFILFIVIGFFYIIFSHSNNPYLNSATSSFNTIFNTSKLKTGFNIMVKTTLQLLVIYFPVVILLLLNFKKLRQTISNRENEVLILFTTIFSSLLTWALFCTTIDSVQFFNNYAITIINILSLLLFYYTFTYASKKKKTIAYILFFLTLTLNFNHNRIEINFTQKYNENDLLAISKKVKAQDNPIGVLIKDKKDYIDNGIYEKYSILGQYTILLNKSFDFIPLTISDIPLDTNSYTYSFEKNAIINSEFYQYVIKSDSVLDKNISKVNFIKDKKIDFLVTTKNVELPKEISSLVKDSVIETVSGERFYFLK